MEYAGFYDECKVMSREAETLRIKKQLTPGNGSIIMKVVFIFLVCLCFTHIVHAQKKILLKGCVVTLNGDTLKGFIDDRVDKELILGVNFYGENSKSGHRYSPAEITEFKTGNRIFRRFSATDSTYQFGKLVNEGTLSFLVSYKGDKFVFFVRNNTTEKSATLERPRSKDAKKRHANFLYLNNLLTVANLSTDLAKTKPIGFQDKKLRKFVTNYNREANSLTAKEYADNIIHHNLFTVGMIKYSKEAGYLTDNPGYTLSYFFSKENRDINRSGIWIHGIRYESISREENFPYKSGSFKANTSTFQLLPIGYRYSPIGTKIKPYLLGIIGLEINREKAFDEGSAVSPTIDLSARVISTIGGGISVNVGKGNLILESTLASFHDAYRVSIGYDFAK